MPHLLHMADEGQPREPRLHQHPVLPRSSMAPFAGGRRPRCSLADGIAQDEQAAVALPPQPLARLGRRMGRRTVPPHHQALVVHPEPEVPVDSPALLGQAFAPALLWAAAVAEGVKQRKARGIAPPKPRWGRPDRRRPGRRRLEEAPETGARGEPATPRPLGASQPARDGPVAPAFAGRPEPQGPPCPGPAMGRRGLGGAGSWAAPGPHTAVRHSTVVMASSSPGQVARA